MNSSAESDDLAAPARIPVRQAIRGPDELPDDLPPVQPPSAGFIVQLFVVPALIVMLVIAVWALFGRLAATEQDWRQLVSELGSNNEHRRWRAANGLAHLLDTDRRRAVAGRQLSENRHVAEELTKLLSEQLGNASQKPDDLVHQEFLARTLGLLDVHDVVLPVLVDAMQPSHDRVVRKNAIASVAVILGRATEKRLPIDSSVALEGLLATSGDPDPLIRQLIAYSLGLFEDDAASRQLEAMLVDADRSTRYNAAIGLARQGSTVGMPVFEDVLREAVEPSGRVPTDKPTGNAAQTAQQTQHRLEDAKQFQEPVMLANLLKAVDQIWSDLSPGQQTHLREWIAPIADQYPSQSVRLGARAFLQEHAAGS